MAKLIVLMPFKNSLLLFLFFPGFYFCTAQVNGPGYTAKKKIICSKAAVVSAHPLASKAGIQVLKAGGNAFDAAIATQLALAVVYPGAGNIGGGGFLVAHGVNGKNISIDFREKAPAKASRDMYLDSSGNPVSQLSKDGHLAAGVPGTVAGLFATWRYARLPFTKLIQPAIDLAEKGFAITASQANSFNDNRSAFLTINKQAPVFVKAVPWKTGDTLIQKELAHTLRRIQQQGQQGFYEGETAKMIVEEMQSGNGIISYEDLKAYKAIERNAIAFNYKTALIVTAPLPSSGGIVLQQMMKMVEGRHIGSMGFLSAAAVHLMTEVERRAYADRSQFLGDNDFVKVPVEKLVSRQYLEERMKDFDPLKAGNSTVTGAGNIPESEETTHISIIDAAGNAVSVTTTLNGSYGSRTVVSGAGFLLNNEMDDFSVKPGVPNMYGALGNEKNAIAAGKRMLSSMTPTIVVENGKPVIIVGTPGGTTITTSVFQSLVNLLEFKLDPSDAVNKPKFHHQWLPDILYIEQDFPVKTKEALEAMGYQVNYREPIGRTELIKVNYCSARQVIAVADNRGDDGAEGF